MRCFPTVMTLICSIEFSATFWTLPHIPFPPKIQIRLSVKHIGLLEFFRYFYKAPAIMTQIFAFRRKGALHRDKNILISEAFHIDPFLRGYSSRYTQTRRCRGAPYSSVYIRQECQISSMGVISCSWASGSWGCFSALTKLISSSPVMVSFISRNSAISSRSCR